MGYALWSGGWEFNPLQLLLFLILFASGGGWRLGFYAALDLRVGLADAQPKPVRDVVAVHDADALSARDLPDGMGSAGGLVLLVRRAR